MPHQDTELSLLREIRDNQRSQLDRQAEALDLQRSQFEMARAQLERAERLQGRAESLQGHARKAVGVILWIALPLVVLLLLLMAWPYLRSLAA